ncbi:MAG: 50S ribosomal protein L4 [Chitinophagales bacterium]|nr:MAG: 50S ribosomal protein L4 [Chitinophagales bacterium]
MKVKVLNIEGKETRKSLDLADDIFNIEPNDHAIYLAVKQHLANKRQGTHKTLEKSEVSGSTRKLHRQKGTGGSRKGSIKNPLFRGGARVFGPKPRDYNFKLNKKIKDLARKSALSYKVRNNELVVVEDFTLERPKTKELAQILKNLGADASPAVLLIHNNDKNVVLSGRNLPKTEVALASGIHTYQVMKAKKLILTESSVKQIEEILKN